MAIQNFFVPRTRIATFNVVLRIDDLNNVPPLNGLFYAKWKCQDHSGSSARVPVANREVKWSYVVEKSIDIPVGKDAVLTPCGLRVSIKQEVYPHVRVKIGELAVNLSEYARLSGSSRRYFLQECKLNCTLKLSIYITQVGGPENFDVPPLDRSMLLTDLNDMITSESSNRNGRENSTTGNSFSSRQPSVLRNANINSASTIRTNTTKSNTTETSQSRALLPIDDTNVRDLAPFQRSSKKNQQIIDDIFLSPQGLPT
ncbi:hypothetical protein GQ54DRAFT_186269 [Martensiomyces pterosporus]|nr:hypothetical protein GQ54DRAFT_186269 [Martensiomyces pterosporus]